jgi:hypothetical protein
MNPRFLAFIATVAAVLSAIGGADLAGFISLLPDSWASAFAVALPALAAFKHFLDIFGDIADDGKRNNSFNPTLKVLPVLLWLTLGVLSFGTLACKGLSLQVTPDGRVIGSYEIPPEGIPIVEPRGK